MQWSESPGVSPEWPSILSPAPQQADGFSDSIISKEQRAVHENQVPSTNRIKNDFNART
jgi:hypothetical protein